MIKLSDIVKSIKESQESYKIYLDIDGVLVDFDGGFKKLTGQYPNDFERKYGTEEFWRQIPTDTTKFWKELEWMPDGKQLFQYTEKYKPTLLSAPSKAQTSKQGKREWRDINIPGVKLILKGAKFKHEYAKPNHILIDDRADNIERWISAGGIGIEHFDAVSTIKKLKQLGL